MLLELCLSLAQIAHLLTYSDRMREVAALLVCSHGAHAAVHPCCAVQMGRALWQSGKSAKPAGTWMPERQQWVQARMTLQMCSVLSPLVLGA